MKAATTIAVFAMLASCCSYASTSLTNAAAVVRMIAARPSTYPKFRISGQIVLHHEKQTGEITLRDSSGFIRVYTQRTLGLQAKPGDWVSVKGVICPLVKDTFVAYANELSVLAHGDAPPPVDADADDIYSGRLTYGNVRLRGTVLDVFKDETDARFSFLILSVAGKPIGLPSAQVSYEKLSRLIGAEISVVGLCSSYFGHGPRAKLEYEVYIESENDISVLSPPKSDPFDVPDFTGNVYSIIYPKAGDSLRRKIRGRVEGVDERGRVFIRASDDEVSTVHLLSAEALPAVGDFIECAGIAETDFYSRNLSRAIWRPAQPTFDIAEPETKPCRIREIFFDRLGTPRFNADLNGNILRVCGTVTALDCKADGSGKITLRDDGASLELDASNAPLSLDDLETGCVIAATGLCVAETENWRFQSPFPHIESMKLVLRSATDITVLARPPWWTPARLRLAVLVLLSVILAFCVYSFILTGILRRRNRELDRERQVHERTNIRRLERTRLAIELHDSLVQMLTGTAMEVETARKLGALDHEEMSTHLRRAEKTLQSCRAELRNSIWDLRSDALEEETLEGAISRTLTPHVNKARVKVKFSVRRDILPDNTCHAVIKIIRELTINATNHGHARLVKIAGMVEEGTLYFSVIDDGTGFDVDSRPGVIEGHFGLQGVKERVNSLNGTFTITSSPGRGTKARITIPLEPEIT